MISVKNKFLIAFPEITAQIDNSKHPNIDFSIIPAGSNKPLDWICDNCNDSYSMIPNHRTRRGSGCPKLTCKFLKRSITNKEKFGWNSHLHEPKKIEVEPRIIPEHSEIDEEIWKDLPIDLFLSNYQVSSVGRFRNKSTNIIALISIRRDGYIAKSFINDKGESVGYLCHVLVAKTFHLNLENKPTVNHINKIRDDNRAINLEWATYSEQKIGKRCKKQINGIKPIDQFDLNNIFMRRWESATEAEVQLNISKKNIGKVLKGERSQSGGFKWKYSEVEVIPDEIWKKVPLVEYEEIYASNLGRIRKTGSQPNYGTLLYSDYYGTRLRHITENKTYHSFQVHRLVAFTFLENPEKKPFVNHIDENRGNNNLENLEWVTNDENMDKYHENNSKNRTKPLYQCDEDWNIIRRYDSIKKVELDFIGVPGISNLHGTMKKMAKKGSELTCAGFKWIFCEDCEEI